MNATFNKKQNNICIGYHLSWLHGAISELPKPTTVVQVWTLMKVYYCRIADVSVQRWYEYLIGDCDGERLYFGGDILV